MSQLPTDMLSPERMQLFLAGLGGLPPEEIRKAKVLYIRNAIAEYRAMEANLKAFGVAQGCFAIIPIFWPILWSQRRAMATQLQLARQKIQNAMDVWKGDLQGERFDFQHVETA